MDQTTLFERMQRIIDAYEQTLNKRYNLLQRDILGILGDYYTKYGEHINDYAKYGRLKQLEREVNNTARVHFQQIQTDLEQATTDTVYESYLLYAYLLYLTFGEQQHTFPIPTALGATDALVALVLFLLKKSKSPFDYFKDEHIDLAFVLNKHRADYAYGVFTDVKNNLRSGAGLKDASERVKKRTETTERYGVARLYELLNDAVSYVQDKVYDIANDPTQYIPKQAKDIAKRVANYAADKAYEASKDGFDVEKFWISMKDWRVRLPHRVLDGTWSKDGWFHYQGDRARRPKTWKSPSMNYGCRCKLFLSFNGQIPRTSAVYDYRDVKYQIRLNERIEELENDGKTYWQALKQADKEIKPPRRRSDTYITYEDWEREYGGYDG